MNIKIVKKETLEEVISWDGRIEYMELGFRESSFTLFGSDKTIATFLKDEYEVQIGEFEVDLVNGEFEVQASKGRRSLLVLSRWTTFKEAYDRVVEMQEW